MAKQLTPEQIRIKEEAERNRQEARIAREKKKLEKIRREGHNWWWYLIPGNAKREADEMGIDYDFKDNISNYGVFLALALGMSILFDVQIWAAILIVISVMLFVPSITMIRYRGTYEDKRFQDINVYMEQFLYSFREKKKVVTALTDIRTSFDKSPLGEMIDTAVDMIMAPGASSTVEEEALDEIETSYPTEKLLTIHKFALRVEKIGGDFSSTCKILLHDRNLWETRMDKVRAEKKQKLTFVTISIIASILLCGFFVRLLPMALDGFTISHNFLVQIFTILMIFLDMFVYTRTLKLTNGDILTVAVEEEEKLALRRYYKIVDWDDRVEFLKSIRYAIPVGAISVFCFLASFLSESTHGLFLGIAIVTFLLAIFMLFQHKMDYSLTKKNVEGQIMQMFPRWLIDIALLLQTDNVQVALFKSFEDAPAILKPELKKMYDALEANPTSIDPYLNFMRGFEVKGIQSSMKMLYNIYAGNGGSSDNQISEIIERNNEMVNFAEEQRNKNAVGGYSGILLIPVFTSGMKLLIDMVIFFAGMMQQMGGMSGM